MYARYPDLKPGQRNLRPSGPPLRGAGERDPGSRERCHCGLRVRGPNHEDGMHHKREVPPNPQRRS